MKINKIGLGFGFLGVCLSFAKASTQDCRATAIMSSRWGIYNTSYTLEELRNEINKAEKNPGDLKQGPFYFFSKSDNTQDSGQKYKPLPPEEIKKRWAESPLSGSLDEKELKALIRAGFHPYSTKSNFS